MTSVTGHKVDGKAEIYSLCDVDDKRYSSLRKLLRITIYCLKFIKRMVWHTLSHLTKTTIAEKHKLIAHVLNSLADNFSICADDIKVVTLNNNINNKFFHSRCYNRKINCASSSTAIFYHLVLRHLYIKDCCISVLLILINFIASLNIRILCIINKLFIRKMHIIAEGIRPTTV